MIEREKDIVELGKKIYDLKNFAQEKQNDFSPEIGLLEDRLTKMREDALQNLSPMDKLTLSRMVERPTSLDYIERVFDVLDRKSTRLNSSHH